MNRWIVAVLAGLLGFMVLLAVLFVYPLLMGSLTSTWQQTGAELSSIQLAAVHAARIIRAAWFLIAPFLFLVCLGSSLVVAALVRRK